MKKIQNNLHYFEISKNNQEKLLDNFYVFDEKHPDLNKYIKNTKEIKNLLITIRTLQSKKEKSAVIDKYFLELSKIIGKYFSVIFLSKFISFFASFIILSQAFTKQANSEQLEYLPMILDNSKKYLSITADFSFLLCSVLMVIKIFFISLVFWIYLFRSGCFSSNT